MRVAASVLFVLSVVTTLPFNAQDAPEAPSATPATDSCAKAVTIYLDTSGTMTRPIANRGSRLPISDIAQTLLRFVNAENFLAADDTVTIKYFGAAARTQAENRQAALALLDRLANPATATAAADELKSGSSAHLRNLTDFSRLFDDLENRLRNAPSRRQIVFIASDFAHDHLNSAQGRCAPDAPQRIEHFKSSLARVRSRLEAARTPDDETFGRVEIAGLFAPEGTCASDNAVAREVQNSLKELGVRFYRYDEDAAEAALTINNQLRGAVTAQPATAGVAQLGADNRVAFRIANPNCIDARVVALQFSAGDRDHRVDVTPFTIGGTTRETRVELDKLATIWNRETRVTPVIAPGTSLSTEPSAPFWLGDWVRVRRMTPYLYPRTFREGQSLVAATLERNLQAPASLTVSGIDASGRTRGFELGAGSGEELYLLPFDLNDALAARLSGPARNVNLGTTGIRLLLDEKTAVADTSWPLTSPSVSQAAALIDWIAGGSLALYVLLFLWIVGRTFSRHADNETQDQVSVWSQRMHKLWPGMAASLLLLITRFRSPVVPDIQMWLLAGWRSVVIWLAVFLLIRAVLVETLWKQYIEQRLLPADRAVKLRRRWNAVTYVIAFIVGLWVLYGFFGGPTSAPPPGATILRGVMR